jgi:ribonuclease VapC
MIAVDSSALVAIVLGEPEAERLLDTLQQSAAALSAANLLEAAIVVEARQGPDAARDLELLVDGTIDEIASVDLTIVETALSAWRRFGKGRHPAGLNYGDCFAYALARNRAIPLLFIGDDFAKTDVEEAAF